MNFYGVYCFIRNFYYTTMIKLIKKKAEEEVRKTNRKHNPLRKLNHGMYANSFHKHSRKQVVQHQRR